MIVFFLIAGLIACLFCAYLGLPLLRKTQNPKRSNFMIAGFIGLLPILAFSIYTQIGAPSLSVPATPPASVASDEPNPDVAAIAQLPEAERQDMINAMVARLSERLTREDGSIEDWRMLARSYGVLGDNDNAIATHAHIAARADASIEDQREYVIAWTRQRRSDEEPIDAPIIDALNILYAENKADPLPLFFLGMAAKQSGDNERASFLWTKLNEQVPADAPLKVTLENFIEELNAPQQ